MRPVKVSLTMSSRIALEWMLMGIVASFLRSLLSSSSSTPVKLDSVAIIDPGRQVAEGIFPLKISQNYSKGRSASWRADLLEIRSSTEYSARLIETTMARYHTNNICSGPINCCHIDKLMDFHVFFTSLELRRFWNQHR